MKAVEKLKSKGGSTTYKGGGEIKHVAFGNNGEKKEFTLPKGANYIKPVGNTLTYRVKGEKGINNIRFDFDVFGSTTLEDAKQKGFYAEGGEITVDDVDEWEVVNDWASWKEIHPKYKVSYGQIVTDINDMNAFDDLYDEDVDSYYKEWKEQYGLKKWDKKEVGKIADILWKDLLETSKKENAFEKFVKQRNAEVKKRMADIPENYRFTKRIYTSPHTGGTGKYIFKHHHTGKELELDDFTTDNISSRMVLISKEQALKNYFKNKGGSTYEEGGTIIKKGNRVRVVNTQYDGKEGLVVSNDLHNGNYQVQMQDGKVKGFPFENLMLLSRETYAGGGEIKEAKKTI